MAEAAHLTAVIDAQIDGLQRGFQQADRLIDGFVGNANRLGASLATGLAAGAGFAAAQAGLNGIAGAMDAVRGTAIGFNSEMQKAQIAFTALAGGEQRANQFLGQLKELAATTPFEFQDVLKGAQRFAGMGVEIEKVIPLMKDVSVVAQAFGASSAQIGEINLAISQVIARGKVSAQEMNQLANAGVQGWQILAQSMGKSIGEVMKLAEKGQISADQFVAAFHKAASDPKLQELAQNMNKSFDTAASNVHDRVQFLVSDAFRPLFDAVTAGANAMADALATPAFTNFGRDIAATFTDVIDKLQPMKQAIADAFAGGGLQAAGAELLTQIGLLARQVFGGGVAVAQEFASGILEGGVNLIASAAEAIADIVANFFGHSMPTDGPLVNVGAGGQSVAEAWLAGFGGADWAAAGEHAEDVIRGLDEQIRTVEQSSHRLHDAAQDIADAFDAQREPLERQLELLKDQNDLANKQADIQAHIRDLQRSAAEKAAMGDPVKRAQLENQKEALDQQIAQLRNQESLNRLAREAAGQKPDDKADLASKQRIAQLEAQRLQVQNQLDGMVDREALARLKVAKAADDQVEGQRKIAEEQAKLTREMDAAPIEKQLADLKRAQQDMLKPINDQIKANDRVRTGLQEQKQDWAAVKAKATDALSDITKAHAAAEKAAKSQAAASQGATLAGLPTLKLEDAAKKAGERAGESLLGGIQAKMAELGPRLFGGAAGALLGGAALGPIGFAAGGLFGAKLVEGLEARIPDFGKRLSESLQVLSDSITTVFQVFKGDWSPDPAKINPFTEAVGELALRLQGPLRAAADWFTTTGWPALVTAGQGFASWVQQSALPALTDLAGWLGEHLPPVMAWLSDTAWPALVTAGAGFADWLRGTAFPALGELVTWLGTNIPPVVNWIKDTGWPGLVTAGGTLVEAVEKIITGLQNLYTELEKKGVFDDLRVIWDRLRDMGDQLYTSIGVNLTPSITTLGTESGTAATNMAPLAANIKELVGFVKEATDPANQFAAALTAIQQAAVNAGLAINQFFKDLEARLGEPGGNGGLLGQLLANLSKFAGGPGAGPARPASGNPHGGPDIPAVGGQRGGLFANNVGQFAVGLPAAEAFAACGPYAALVFANAVGRYPTAQEAVDLARQVGWTEGGGMAGPASEINLLGKLGVNAVQQAATFGNAQAAIAAGGPVGFSTPRHYFAATDVNAAGAFNVGGTGTALAGGKPWMTIEEMTALGGGMQSIIVLAGQMGDAVAAAAVGATSAADQAITATARKYGMDPRVFLALADAESSRNPLAVGDGGRSVGLFQLSSTGIGAGMSVAQRQDPTVNAERFIGDPRVQQLYQQFFAGLDPSQITPDLVSKFGGAAEGAAKEFWDRYGAAFRALGATAGPALADGIAAPLAQAKTGFAALWDQVANGQTTLDLLQSRLVALASQNGVAGAATEIQNMTHGVESAGTALQNVADVMAQTNPQIAEWLHLLRTGSIDAAEFALRMLQVFNGLQKAGEAVPTAGALAAGTGRGLIDAFKNAGAGLPGGVMGAPLPNFDPATFGQTLGDALQPLSDSVAQLFQHPTLDGANFPQATVGTLSVQNVEIPGMDLNNPLADGSVSGGVSDLGSAAGGAAGPLGAVGDAAGRAEQRLTSFERRIAAGENTMDDFLEQLRGTIRGLQDFADSLQTTTAVKTGA